MKFKYFCQTCLLASGLIVPLHGFQPAFAESFSFKLNGLGITESPEGDRTLSGSLSIDGEQRSTPQHIDFDLTHGDRGDHHSLEMGLRNQGESVLNAVLDLFGLTSQSQQDTFDAEVSGDINPTESKIDISLGQDKPGMRLKIQTPQGIRTQ